MSLHLRTATIATFSNPVTASIIQNLNYQVYAVCYSRSLVTQPFQQLSNKPLINPLSPKFRSFAVVHYHIMTDLPGANLVIPFAMLRARKPRPASTNLHCPDFTKVDPSTQCPQTRPFDQGLDENPSASLPVPTVRTPGTEANAQQLAASSPKDRKPRPNLAAITTHPYASVEAGEDPASEFKLQAAGIAYTPVTAHRGDEESGTADGDEGTYRELRATVKVYDRRFLVPLDAEGR